MSVFDTDTLEQSPLSDLHAIASEVGIDDYRKLRKEELVKAIQTKQSRGNRAPRSRQREVKHKEGEVIEGKANIKRSGSSFIKVTTTGWEGGDVFLSGAQVRRFGLKANDTVSGPVRPPRRSERYYSLLRVEQVNGKSAEEKPRTNDDRDKTKSSTSTRGGRGKNQSFDQQEATYPNELITFSSSDKTLSGIERLTPFGKGSRVLVHGTSLSGKSELLKLFAQTLQDNSDYQVGVVLAGLRPEEVAGWEQLKVKILASKTFDAKQPIRNDAIRKALDDAKKAAASGKNYVLIVDSLDDLDRQSAQKLFLSGRNLTGSGSLTTIASAQSLVSGATTLITLNSGLAAAEKFPPIDLTRSNVIKPELLVGKRGKSSIAKAAAKASR